MLGNPNICIQLNNSNLSLELCLCEGECAGKCQVDLPEKNTKKQLEIDRLISSLNVPHFTIAAGVTVLERVHVNKV